MRTAFAMLGLLAGSAQAATTPTGITPDNSVYCLNYATTPTNVVTNPSLVRPQDIAIDGNGDIFVVDSERRELMQIDGTDFTSKVLLGPEWLEIPVGLTISQVHADLYIGDENTSTIWHLPCQTRNNNYCTQYYTTPLNLTLATAVHPMGLHMDLDDHLYIADFNGHRVLKRDVSTGAVTIVLNEDMMGSFAPDKDFGPHDIAIDQNTNELLVTDQTNDDIWTVACGVPSVTGLSCDQYTANPYPLTLDGSGSDISAPSGITTDLSGTIYVTGMVNGVVDEIKGNTSVNLLSSSTVTLNDPVSVAYDPRNTAKTLYISDDPQTGSTTVGLYSLACTEIVCVELDERYVAHVTEGTCGNVPTGSKCDFTCQDGFESPNVTTITCGASGWETEGVMCLSTSAASGDDSAGVAVGVTLAVLVILGVAVFLFIRYRQGKLVVKKTGDYAPFGSAGV